MDRVFIFGTGKFGIQLMKKLQNKYDIIGFIDNNSWEKQVCGKKVFRPLEVKKYEFSKVIIGSNSFSSIDYMVSQLVRIGLDRNEIDCEYAMKKKKLTTAEVFSLQHISIEEKNRLSFLRYNLIIHILAIENMYGINDIGLELSKKYRKIVMPDDDIDRYIKRFKYLVTSFKKDGFRENSYISLNKKGELIDGTHRFALLIMNNVKEVDVRILNTYWQLEGECDLDWLTFHNDIFNEKEIDIIVKKYDDIRKKILG